MYEIIHWDTETRAITAGCAAPPPVCLQWLGVPVGASAPPRAGIPPEELARLDGPHLLDGDLMVDWWLWALGGDFLLSGLNQAYDVLVMNEAAVRRGVPLVDVWTRTFDMLARGRQRCTECRQRLIRIARGQPDYGLSLADQALEYLGLDLTDQKEDPHGWRLRFEELERWPVLVARAAYPLVASVHPALASHPDEPLLAVAARHGIAGPVAWGDESSFCACAVDVLTAGQASALLRGELVPGAPRSWRTWPPEAIDYARKDPLHERGIYRGQAAEAVLLFGSERIPDEVARPIAKLMLHMSSSRGLRTDGARARRAARSLSRTLDLLRDVLVEQGLMRRRVIHAGKPQQRVEYSKNMDALHGRIVATLEEAGHRAERKPPTEKMREKAAAARAKGDDAKADKLLAGNVRADKEVLQLAELAADPGLRAKVAYDGAEKLLSTYVLPLAIDCGAPAPGWTGLERPMIWRYEVLKNTGRTSAKAARYQVLRDGAAASERDGNNVQNYSTGDTMLVKARDILSVVGHGDPGDGEYDDDFAEAVREAVAAGQPPPERPDEYGMSPEEFRAYREVMWARRHDVRSMVVAREGHLLVNRDYSGIEMVTLAQCQVIHFGGPVTLSNVLNDMTLRTLDVLDDKGEPVVVEGIDPHLYVGVFVHAILWGEQLSYEQLVTIRHVADAKKKRLQPLTPQERRVLETRKLCKVINFGFLGGMGAATFVQYVWQRARVRLTIERAKELKRAWYQAFPEMPGWFAYIGAQVDADAPVVQLGSGRVRGGCTFTQNANTRFQGLAADGALNALFLIWRECLCDPSSPLYGARPLVFEHDAFLVEVPTPANDPEYAVRADVRLAYLMVAGMRELVPDVVVRTEGSKPSRRWPK